MRSILVVLRFPPLQFSSEVFFVPKAPPSIELFRVCRVTSLYLAIYLWASGRDVTTSIGNPDMAVNRWVTVPNNRAHGAEGQNRSCSITWAEKQEKFQPAQECFF